jgi:RNA polymerase sigma-70 factor (ECF subfamily)
MKKIFFSTNISANPLVLVNNRQQKLADENHITALAQHNNIVLTLPVSEMSVQEGHNELNALVRECIAQSRGAQKKLYDQYAPGAYSIIKRYLYNDDAAAQEVLNDSFYKIFTKLEMYSFQGAFEGWIRRIVINTVTDHLRKTIKDDQQHKEIQPEDAFINSSSLDNIAHKELLQIINTLPDTQRTIFNLFVFENYSHKEIAKLLNLNENNCRWHLNDARKRLKEKIYLQRKQ